MKAQETERVRGELEALGAGLALPKVGAAEPRRVSRRRDGYQCAQCHAEVCH